MMKLVGCFLGLLLSVSTAFSAEIFVDDVATNGDGSQASPFNLIQNAINAAYPGDIILIMPGLYDTSDQINTIRNGTATEPIIIQAFDKNQKPTVTRPNGERRTGSCILGIDHEYIILDSLIFDGEFQPFHTLYINKNGHNTIIRNCIAHYSGADAISVSGASDVLILNSEIHHCLSGTEADRDDAHGVSGVQVTNLTIRGCNIHHVTGDSVQVDPSAARGAQMPDRFPPHDDRPEWDNVLIEKCKLWTGPINMVLADWSYDYIPGENALDTKTNPLYDGSTHRARVVVRDCIIYGWVDETDISRRSALNLKYTVDALIENCIVYNNEIAFRVRGDQDDYYTEGTVDGAHVTLKNNVSYGNDMVFRIENNIEQLHVFNCTFDKPLYTKVSIEQGNPQATSYIRLAPNGYPAAYDPAGFLMQNCLFVGTKPTDAADASNLSAQASWFLDRSNHDYHLLVGSPAIDAGGTIPNVTTDLNGKLRDDGSYDSGAYEDGWLPLNLSTSPLTLP